MKYERGRIAKKKKKLKSHELFFSARNLLVYLRISLDLRGKVVQSPYVL